MTRGVGARRVAPRGRGAATSAGASPNAAPGERFDAAYYRRFYGRRPVHTAAHIAELAAAMWHLAAWWGVPIRSVLEVGAGPGYWSRWVRAQQPRARVLAVDVSTHACERYGHEQRDISAWRPARAFDLVVCQGVLQYLTDAQADAAIVNLAAATRSLLYLEVPTRHDRAAVLDRDASDLDVHFRTAAWYRARLDAHFAQAGCGVWVTHGAVAMYELERARRR